MCVCSVLYCVVKSRCCWFTFFLLEDMQVDIDLLDLLLEHVDFILQVLCLFFSHLLVEHGHLHSFQDVVVLGLECILLGNSVLETTLRIPELLLHLGEFG